MLNLQSFFTIFDDPTVCKMFIQPNSAYEYLLSVRLAAGKSQDGLWYYTQAIYYIWFPFNCKRGSRKVWTCGTVIASWSICSLQHFSSTLHSLFFFSFFFYQVAGLYGVHRCILMPSKTTLLFDENVIRVEYCNIFLSANALKSLIFYVLISATTVQNMSTL